MIYQGSSIESETARAGSQGILYVTEVHGGQDAGSTMYLQRYIPQQSALIGSQHPEQHCSLRRFLARGSPGASPARSEFSENNFPPFENGATRPLDPRSSPVSSLYRQKTWLHCSYPMVQLG